VIAHEVGHHVQNLLGISARCRRRGARRRARGQCLSVRLELQADAWPACGPRTPTRPGILEAGDRGGGPAAATAIGDDTLQKQAQGYAVPDSFTHGSAEQRMRWFKRGMESGQLAACNTFQAGSL
jgi:predicted metalloprotease